MRYVIQNPDGLFYTGNALSLWGSSAKEALKIDSEKDANDIAEGYEMRNGKPLGTLAIVPLGDPMSAPKHTKGPWIAQQNEARGEVYIWARSAHPEYGDKPLFRTIADQREHTDHEANAARVVACVNACEGLADPGAIQDMWGVLTAVRNGFCANNARESDILAQVARVLARTEGGRK